MMRGLLRFVRRHWPTSVLAFVGLVAGGLESLHQPLSVHILLAVVALAYAVLPLVDGWNAFRSGSLRIDILPAITIITALFERQYWIAYAVAAAYIITKTVVNALYRRAHRTNLSLSSLPATVPVLRGRKTIDTPISNLHLGDKFVSDSGAIMPVDSTIVEGHTTYDESMLTANSQAMTKPTNATVLSGSRNSGTSVTVKVLRSAHDSYLQSIIRLLNKDSGEHTTFVRTSDRNSIYLTIAALLIASAGWYVGHTSHRFLAVMVLATVTPALWPTRIALQGALVKMARQGIIFRSGAAIQKLVEAETIAFGFTSIITEGRPTLTKISALKPYTKNEVLGLAASLEQASNHPLAAAVVAEAQTQGFNFIKAKHVQTLTGQGLKANLQGKEVLVGNASLLIEHGIQLPIKVAAQHLVLYVASAGELVGTLSFEDTTRASVEPAFASLRKRGVAVLQILTSSPQPAVETATAGLGTLDIHADAPTADKLNVLATNSQRPVAFVGKALADSSLLTAADVGVALGEYGTAHGPGITILPDDVAYVALARSTMQRAFNIAIQSLLGGSLLSIGLMLLAMTGTIPLLLGVALQLVINLLALTYPLLRSQKS